MIWNLIKWLFSLHGGKTIYGSSRFLTGFHKWRILNPFNKGFVLDGKNKITLKRSRQHCIAIAPTGAGKTTKLILPNVLRLDGPSVVITDPSGEILQNSRGYLRSKGYQIKVLDFTNPTNSHKYNPLSRASGSQIDKLSAILVGSAYQDSKGEAFWNNSAEHIITLIIRAVKGLPEEKQNLGEVYRILNKFGHKQEEVNRLMSEKLDERSFEMFAGFLSQDDKVLNSILSTAKTALSKFGDENIDLITASETLHFESIRSERVAIILIIPEFDTRYFSFILSIFYSQLFFHCLKTEINNDTRDVFYLLDEFGNSGSFGNNFSSVITTARKKKISILAVLQDFEMLVEVFGKSAASTIFNGGFNSKIYYPGLSLQSCEELSRTLGKRTLSYKEAGYNDKRTGSIPDRDRDLGRELLTADEIRTLKSNRAICISGSELPILLKTTPWYKNRKLKRRAKIQ